MITIFSHNMSMRKRGTVRGFILPLTLVICLIILTISTGISILLVKGLYFSKLSRQSQLAYYAADNGLMCAIMVDDNYIDPATGIGIFQYNNVTPDLVLAKINTDRQARGYGSLTLNDIKCATSRIFSATESRYSVENFSFNRELGKTTEFSLTMDLGDGTYRCADVMINKTSSYRQIVSRGYASCPDEGRTPIERAIVNTSEGQ